ncbi:MAG: response regulator transcription factor [Chitinophagaceae bacterium]
MNLKIAVTDDHLMVINGLKAMLDQVPGTSLLFWTLNGEDLLRQLEIQQPDILLLDIQLGDIPGTELCRRVKRLYPDVKVMALTSHQDTSYVRQMLRNGASGHLLKNTDVPTLYKALSTVQEGKQYIDEQISQNILHEALSTKRVSRYEIPLTKREKEILVLVAEEMSNQEIADKLFISLRTVETHRFNIIQKLGIKNTAGLVKEAIRRGLI